MRQPNFLLSMKPLIRQQKGQMLIEVLIALAILGIVAVAFLSALTTTALVLVVADQKTTAESLTRSQLESIATSEYQVDGNYELIDEIPNNYLIDIDVEQIKEGLQKVTVTVYQQDRLILTTSDYKIKR